MTRSEELASYTTSARSEWAALRYSTPLMLSDSDLTTLRGLNEPIALDEVVDEFQIVRQPDVLIFEGLNVLQAGHTAPVMISDFFDFSVYVDAGEADIEAWYIERFLILQRTASQQPTSYFHHYSGLSAAEARDAASRIWREINLVNLQKNILPTRTRADVVLRKRSDHSVSEVWLRRT